MTGSSLYAGMTRDRRAAAGSAARGRSAMTLHPPPCGTGTEEVRTTARNCQAVVAACGLARRERPGSRVQLHLEVDLARRRQLGQFHDQGGEPLALVAVGHPEVDLDVRGRG